MRSDNFTNISELDLKKMLGIEKNGKNHTFDTKSKKEVSKDIVNLLQNYL